MHMCDECGKNPANVHLTQVVNDQTNVFRLCEECARRRGISISIGMPQESAAVEAQSSDPAEASVVCSRCETSLADFREKGWLGCPSCYHAFADEVDGLLMRVHGSRRHKGKQYRRSGAAPEIIGDVGLLRKELEAAVRDEKFELAAAIRDKIHTLVQMEPAGHERSSR